MSYLKIREILRQLPEVERRFVKGEYWNEQKECACVIGALIPAATGHSGELNEDNIEGLIENDPDVAAYVDEQGFDVVDLAQLQKTNDYFIGTEEARYVRVMHWLDEMIEKESKDE